MTPEFAYFLKVNVAFVLFYAFYRLFFYKDTFFKLRRVVLLAFFGLAVVYPFFNMQDWIREQEPIAEVIYIYSTMISPETSIAENVSLINWAELFTIALLLVYWGVIAFLCIRFCIQLTSILRLAHKSKKQRIYGTTVCSLDKPAGPFSFFRLIFLHPESHSDKELAEILTHEQTHVTQWHSIDVILCELISILCWYNPFVWLLRREVRHNLEYLADHTVIESGYDSKSYQYHLLGLAHQHKGSVQLYNGFNVLHLKNRIGMMNKKRSRAIGRTKYLIFIPVIALLLFLSNMEAIARITQQMALTRTFPTVELPSVIPSFEDMEEAVDELVELSIIKVEPSATPSAPPPPPPPPRITQDISATYTVQPPETTATEEEESMEQIVFTVVEKMPRFPGGDAALLRFVNGSIKYPILAQENGIQGRVVCSFVVDKDGSIKDPEIVRGVDPSLDKEALRVVQLFPKWTPGEQRGVPVRVKYTMPIQFRLQ